MTDRDQNAPNPGKSGSGPEDDAARLKARLEALKSDLGEAIAKDPATGSNAGTSSIGGDAGRGLRAASELVAGVLAGGGLGYMLDRQFGTMPVFLLCLLVAGVVAGFRNLYRLGLRPTQPVSEAQRAVTGSNIEGQGSRDP